ncbi:hypothetical protein QZM59_22145 [Burkholderia cenocepacia]|nr:hypothetical protein [Burkholderia cenocepacia]MDN7643674.1 hypothetical protein [Burkholderia cenocepacia]
MQKFAERLQGYWHGIVTRCRHPLNTSIVEGINNTIIRAAFTGNPR